MSIPKEPRALMINIMYLVLTALLALNVSAEIFNAFKIVDKGLVKSNVALDDQNKRLPTVIADGAKKKESLQVYADRVDGVVDLSNNTTQYIQTIIDTLIGRSGGYIEDKYGNQELKGKKNKDVTTRWLVNDGKGEELKAKLLEVKEQYMQFIDEEDKEAKSHDVAIAIDDETWQKKNKTSWSEMNFKQMPVQATIPIFRKFINDVKSTESMVLNYLAGKVGGTDVVFNKYRVVAAPKKSYIIKGDPYEAEVFLAASAGEDSKTGVAISVDGRNISTNSDGVAIYKTTPNTIGAKKYTARAVVTNPITGEQETVNAEFEYEVGQRSVTVSPSKMNVFYIGVDNPVEISAAGVASREVKVSMSGGGGTITPSSDGTYNVRVTSPTGKGQFAKINVTAPGLNESRDFRVKLIPTPVPMLSNSKGGRMPSGEFKVQQGVRAVLEHFDFEAKCTITAFRTVRVAKRQDPQISPNSGARFSGESQRIISQASPGDRYFFEDIRCTCPGDKAPRDLGSISFLVG